MCGKKFHILGLVLASALVLLFAGGLPAGAQPKADGTVAAKLKALQKDELGMKKFLHTHVFGLDEKEFVANDISLQYVVVDDVTVAGQVYTLLFVGGDDIIGWDIYKKYLPEQLAKAPSKTPTDQQVVDYVGRLTGVAGENFDKLLRQDYELNKAAYTAEYPANFTEEQVLLSVRSGFEYNQKEADKPVLQKAYNEYAALGTLQNALKLYMDLQQKL